MSHESMKALAGEFIAAVEAGDVERVSAIYSDGLELWRNIDPRTLDKRQSLKVVSWLAENVDQLRYEEVEVLVTEEGFVQRHRLRGVSKAAVAVDVAACLVVKVEDGLIVRLEEYLDSAALAPLMA